MRGVEKETSLRPLAQALRALMAKRCVHEEEDGLMGRVCFLSGLKISLLRS